MYSDLDLTLRSIRDRLTEDIEAVIIDDEAEYERARKFVSAFMPRWLDRIRLHDGKQAIFDHYRLDAALRQAVQRKVPLKSGGSLVIDQGEALTAIDINTGKFVGKRDLEETITANNLEACAEVVNQLRLRNIGGIIVIDFVDMEKEANRKKVFKAFTEALEADHSRSNVTKVSELGLVEMTRKRTRESLNQLISDECPACEGRGTVKSTLTVTYEVMREIRRLGPAVAGDTVKVTCAPKVAERLRNQEREFVDALEKRLHKAIEIIGTRGNKPDAYTVQGGDKSAKPPSGSGDGDKDKDTDKKRRGRRGGRGRGRKKDEGATASDA